jgi:DNA segregation ATPase FtsK/SpoIIIE, S-DNA-T family
MFFLERSETRVSDGKELCVSRGLEVLGGLRKTVTDFAKQEEAMVRELKSKRYAIDQKHQGAADQTEAGLTKQFEEARTKFDAEEARIRARHQQRCARLERAQLVISRNIPRRARQARTEWLGLLQMRRFKIERQTAADIDSAGTGVPGFLPQLETQRERCVALERSARRAFGGCGEFLRMLKRKRRPGESAGGAEPGAMLASLQEELKGADSELETFAGYPLPRFFNTVSPFIIFLGILVISIGFAYSLGGVNAFTLKVSGVLALLLTLVLIAVYRSGVGKARPVAAAIAKHLADARALIESCDAATGGFGEADSRRLREQCEAECAAIDAEKSRADGIESEFARKAEEKLKAQAPRAQATNEEMFRGRLARLEAARDSSLGQLTGDAVSRQRGRLEARERDLAALAAEEQRRWTEIESAWKRAIVPLYEAAGRMVAGIADRFPPLDRSFVENWRPSAEFTPVAAFARLEADLAKPPELLPKDSRLSLPGAPQVSLPLSLVFPEQGSLLFETSESGSAAAVGVMNQVILRLLAANPPGKLAFTIVDPVGLGENFAGLMHLADYEESLINRKIWTQSDQIDDRLAELSEHIEKVIQMYLRTEYATITEYNEKAGSVAEKYLFLVVSDFPANFSETAAKRLQSIAASGPRCGVFTLLHWDKRLPMPDGLVPDELRRNSVCLRREGEAFVVGREQTEAAASLEFDANPGEELAASLLHKIGQASVDSNRVEVPFSQIAPKASEMWTADTTSELKVAIGRTGATKQQYLAIGKGTRQHALFAGKTGSGKSTLFHVIITNLALTCSPDQVEFYLIDFKKGVEFKCYATHRLPHARVVAIESDREFGLSVLQRVDEELKRRGDMFRKLGVQDIAGYKKAGGREAIPRTLLIIDEFQEFYTEDDQIAQNASVLFDRIVRQGRAFGIHVLLGSQTLGGAYTLARATLGQMVIRVALQCNEADSYLIMDENNSAPRLLSRPGEGIYNDAAGALEGNSPFQVVWIGDEERDAYLDQVRALADARHDRHRAPIVFEGNAPAEIRENTALAAALETKPVEAPAAARCWLGAPNSIKGPTEAVFHRQSGNNLLIVGQREEAAMTLMGLSLISLAAQCPVGRAKFVFFHSSAPGTPEAEFLESIFRSLPHGVRVVRSHEVGEAMADLSNELKERGAGDTTLAPATFVFIHGLQKFKKLKHEDDFSFSGGDEGADPGALLATLLGEGASLGMHLIVAVDTFNNVGRFLSRKALSEFEMRVVFQMGANDSASLIDSPKAGDLGLHRALLYNEHEGLLETFRPYAAPDAAWIRDAAEKLAATHPPA